MKLIITTILIAIVFTVKSTDRIVQENGPSGTYSSITAAVTAAVDGDIIIINNKISNTPWIEDIIINKSLTFISAVENQKFLVKGIYSIERASNREIIINGMENINVGSVIVNTGSVTPALTTKVNILNSNLLGHIVLDYNGYEVNVISSILKNLIFRYGNVYGSELTYLDVRTGSDTNKLTVNIIGNKIITDWIFDAMNIRCSSSFFNIKNNFIQTISNSSIAMNITDMLDRPIQDNVITNNSILVKGNTGVNISGTYAMLVLNNLIDNDYSSGGIGISNNNSKSYFGYNFISTNFSTQFDGRGDNITNNKSNILNVVYTLIQPTSSDVFYNAGNPSNEFLDLDLTRNDVGCLGGSYSLANFHPINDGKSARVAFVKTPRIVNQGTTFRVDAIGFDK